MKEWVVIQDARDEGYEEGREDGRAEGRAEGEAERKKLQSEIERLRKELTQFKDINEN